MNKLVIQLSGGLGNQMFQYSAGRSISLMKGLELVVDDWSGFVRDRQYKRKYSLQPFSIKCRKATFFERIPIWIHRAEHKILQNKNHLFVKTRYGNFITETQNFYQPEINKFSFNSKTYLFGYWQSPFYFINNEKIILEELSPPSPSQMLYIKMGEQICCSESVAIGVRLYEESRNPNLHTSDGKLINLNSLRKTINHFKKIKPDSLFYVFCTHRSSLLDSLSLPQNTKYITSEEGFKDPLETLWLLSKCKNHIFSASSFYWWGAFLSKKNYINTSQTIFMASNFLNKDSLCPGWSYY